MWKKHFQKLEDMRLCEREEKQYKRKTYLRRENVIWDETRDEVSTVCEMIEKIIMREEKKTCNRNVWRDKNSKDEKRQQLRN